MLTRADFIRFQLSILGDERVCVEDEIDQLERRVVHLDKREKELLDLLDVEESA